MYKHNNSLKGIIISSFHSIRRKRAFVSIYVVYYVISRLSIRVYCRVHCFASLRSTELVRRSETRQVQRVKRLDAAVLMRFPTMKLYPRTKRLLYVYYTYEHTESKLIFDSEPVLGIRLAQFKFSREK